MMSLRVAAPPSVELKELSGAPEKTGGAGATGGSGPCVPAADAAGPSMSSPPPPPSQAEPSPAAAGGSGAPPKAPQASAMKRSDPPSFAQAQQQQQQQQQPRLAGDGGDGIGAGGQLAEALVSPDGTVTEAPRTVKKVDKEPLTSTL